MKTSVIRQETKRILKESKAFPYGVTLIYMIFIVALSMAWSYFLGNKPGFANIDALEDILSIDLIRMILSYYKLSGVQLITYVLLLIVASMLSLGISWYFLRLTRGESPNKALLLALKKYIGFFVIIILFLVFLTIMVVFVAFLGYIIVKFVPVQGLIQYSILATISLALVVLLIYIYTCFAFFNIVYYDGESKKLLSLFAENTRITKGYRFTIFKLLVYYNIVLILLVLMIFVGAGLVTFGVSYLNAMDMNISPATGMTMSIAGVLIIITSIVVLISYYIYYLVNYKANLSVLYNYIRYQKDGIVLSQVIDTK